MGGSKTGGKIERSCPVVFSTPFRARRTSYKWTFQEDCVTAHLITRVVFLLSVSAVAAVAVAGAAPREPIPPAKVDAPRATASGKETAVFAGGCFWGTQAVFERVKGVIKTTAGYSGGSAATATYDQVITETTGHAESMEVVYDPSQITYGQLLRVFFSVAHDPTELNRQGPDVGTSYRSAIFYTDNEQKRIAEAYIAQLDAAKVFPQRIVTELTPLKGFLPRRGLSPGLRAEKSHQPLHSDLRSAEDPRLEAAVSRVVRRLQGKIGGFVLALVAPALLPVLGAF